MATTSGSGEEPWQRHNNCVQSRAAQGTRAAVEPRATPTSQPPKTSRHRTVVLYRKSLVKILQAIPNQVASPSPSSDGQRWRRACHHHQLEQLPPDSTAFLSPASNSFLRPANHIIYIRKHLLKSPDPSPIQPLSLLGCRSIAGALATCKPSV